MPVLLEIAYRSGKDWKQFEDAVKDRYFKNHKTSDHNKSKLANNTKLSMRAYGLIEENDTCLTETGNRLYAQRSDESSLYDNLARHILKNCQGMNFVQCILDMQAAGEEIDLSKLRS